MTATAPTGPATPADAPAGPATPADTADTHGSGGGVPRPGRRDGARDGLRQAGRLIGERVGGLLPGRGDLLAARRSPRRDLLAGLTVAVVALPLALAFGVTSGLGAEA
ncbi:hypothetical protein LQ51_05855, partial [Micromonospora sp. HK10]